MEFVAIDFETANASRDSACSIGIVTFKDGKIVNEYYHLIRPDELDFDPFNVEIHGITEDMVKNEPRFNELWPEILPMLENKNVVAHYAQFDMSVLRKTLDYYNIPYPNFSYICSWILSKKAFPNLLSYRLNDVAESINFQFNHHNALDDAKACGAIVLKALENSKANNFEEFAKEYNFICGHMFSDHYKKCSSYVPDYSKKLDFSKITATNDNIDTDNYLYGKNIAFTGTLLSMPRKEAVQKIVNMGAVFAKTVNKDTNILVFGYLDPKKFAENATTSKKYATAKKLLENGVQIEIINEDDFLKILE